MILDHDRLLKKNADRCIRCSTCMAVCPVARVTPKFPGPKQAGPGAERFRRSGDPSVDSWIDLCLGCHLCEMVCSSGVNISELNLMAKAKYLDEKGRPLRDWFLTHFYLFGRPESLFSPLINLLSKNAPIKRLIEIILKIERKRDFPSYESSTFIQWFKKRRSKGTKKVGYFFGCYTNTNEVDVGKATVQVLEANGFEVILPPQHCCGIPMLGNGDFKGARKMANYNVPSLLHSIRSGHDIIFSSTSCGYMIKYEYTHLLSVQGADQVAEHLYDIFEFLRNLNESKALNHQLKALNMKAAYFIPCHLKALQIGLPALEILRLIPGLRTEIIEADCCGMGGTYGFKKERYEISQEIGRDLVEEIDRLKPDLVLSDCEGCRVQIRHLTGLKVLHPIQVLRDALIKSR